MVVRKNSSRVVSQTDWAKVDSIKDEDIDYTDIPDLAKTDFFKRAIWWPGTKQMLTIRLDPDVLAFFKKQGRGYQTTINLVLRKYVEAQNGAARASRRPATPSRAKARSKPAAKHAGKAAANPKARRKAG